MSSVVAAPRSRSGLEWKVVLKPIRKLLLLGLVAFLIPYVFAFYLCCGLLDVVRNKPRAFSTLWRYFTGNGICTWILAPFNLCMDLLSLPYLNKGVYELEDLPRPYQEEIRKVIETAIAGDLVGKLEQKMQDKKRGMIFFKWYGKNLQTSLDVPAFREPFRYIRTIGVSVFNKKQSTSRHFGPLRVTLRVLYNINDITSKDAYIQVGNQVRRWCDEKLFIFDDTLQHQSFNETDAPRYCMFIDILRPSLMPGVMSAILTGIRFLVAPINAVFYKHWSFIK